MATNNPRIGGWRGHPNSIAALMKYRVPLGSSLLRQCVRCRRVAMRDRALCAGHSRVARRPDTPGRVARRVLYGLARRGLVPGELTATQVWRDTARLPGQAFGPVRLALVLSWDKRDTQPLAWAKAWRDAGEAVRDV